MLCRGVIIIVSVARASLSVHPEEVHIGQSSNGSAISTRTTDTHRRLHHGWAIKYSLKLFKTFKMFVMPCQV